MIKKYKKWFEVKGFTNITWIISPLKLSLESEMIDWKYLKITKKPTCGLNYILNDIYQVPIYVNLSRYDSNGKLIPSDLDLINYLNEIRTDKFK